MKYSIKHLYHIDSSQQKVFEAISTIDGLTNWWTVQTKGDSIIDGKIQFDFGDFQGPKMKVIELQTNNKLMWKCVESPHGWVGHTFEFFLDENDDKTRIRFTHDGWDEQDDFYAMCNFSWGRYLESLRQYCQTGRGEAFGSEGYR